MPMSVSIEKKHLGEMFGENLRYWGRQYLDDIQLILNRNGIAECDIQREELSLTFCMNTRYTMRILAKPLERKILLEEQMTEKHACSEFVVKGNLEKQLLKHVNAMYQFLLKETA